MAYSQSSIFKEEELRGINQNATLSVDHSVMVWLKIFISTLVRLECRGFKKLEIKEKKTIAW